MPHVQYFVLDNFTGLPLATHLNSALQALTAPAMCSRAQVYDSLSSMENIAGYKCALALWRPREIDERLNKVPSLPVKIPWLEGHQHDRQCVQGRYRGGFAIQPLFCRADDSSRPRAACQG